MDPLSIAAAAAGFLATIEQISKRLQSLSRKRQDSAIVKATLDLGQQLVQLKFVTQSLLDRELVGPSDTHSNTASTDLVKQVNLKIQSCEEVLKEVSDLIDQFDDSLKGKGRWVFGNRDKAMALCEQLNRHYNALDMVLSTLLVLTTTETHDIANETHSLARKTLHTTAEVNVQVQLTRELAEEVKDDTTLLKATVSDVGHYMEQLGYDISEMLALLRKFDQQKTWSSREPAGFVSNELCFALERYIHDMSGINPDEIRSRFSSLEDDDHASLRSGWTWNGPRQGAGTADNMSKSHSRFGTHSDRGSYLMPTSNRSLFRFPFRQEPLWGFLGLRAAGIADIGTAPSIVSESVDKDSTTDGFDDDFVGPPMEVDMTMETLEQKPPREKPTNANFSRGEPKVEHGLWKGSPIPTLENQRSVASHVTSSSSPALLDIRESGGAVKAFDAGLKVETVATTTIEKLQQSLNSLWDELVDDRARELSERLSFPIETGRAHVAPQEGQSLLTQRRMYQELQRAVGTVGSSNNAVLELLRRGASPNQPPGQLEHFQRYQRTNPEFAPPLYLAIQQRDIEMVKTLLRFGADPDCHLAAPTPLEELLFQAGDKKAQDQDMEPIVSMAIILASNGASITSPILAAALCLVHTSNDITLLVSKLFLEAGPEVLEQVDLRQQLLLKKPGEVSLVDEILAEALVEFGPELGCPDVCSAIRLQNRSILAVLLNAPTHRTSYSLHLCMETAIACRNLAAIDLLMLHGADPPPDALFVAIEEKSPRSFSAILEDLRPRGTRKGIRKGSRRGLGKTLYKLLPLQECFVKAIEHWNEGDSGVITELLSMGIEPTVEQISTIFELSDSKTIEDLLAAGIKAKDHHFLAADTVLACSILRFCSQNITGEAKESKLQQGVRALLPPSQQEPGLAKSSHSSNEMLLDPENVTWSRQSTLDMVKMLVQEKVFLQDQLLGEVFKSQPMDKELASLLSSEMREINHVVVLEVVQNGELEHVEFLLNCGMGKIDIPGLLETILANSDSTERDPASEVSEGAIHVIFNHWLKGQPTSLGRRSIEFLVRTIPEEIQIRLVRRCQQNPALSTIQLLLHYSGVIKGPFLLEEALAACRDIMNKGSFADATLASWADALVLCLDLRPPMHFAHITRLKHDCLELILVHIQESGLDINKGLPPHLCSPFHLLLSHCAREELAKTILLFCQYGAHINQATDSSPQKLPLIIAAENNQRDSIQTMLECGGDLAKALLFAVEHSHIEAMKGGLMPEAIASGIFSAKSATEDMRAGGLVLDLFRTAVDAGNPEVLSLLFDSGLSYSIDSELDFLGCIAELGGGDRSFDGEFSTELESYCSWWDSRRARDGRRLPCTAGQEERSHIKTEGRAPLLLHIIHKPSSDTKWQMFSILLLRGTAGALDRHPSTEYLLGLVTENLSAMKQMIDIGITITSLSWEKLPMDGKRYIWEQCDSKVTRFIDEAVSNWVHSNPAAEPMDAEMLSFHFDRTSSTQLVFNPLKVYRNLFSENQSFAKKPKLRTKVLTSALRAVSRLDCEALPAFQYYIMASSRKAKAMKREKETLTTTISNEKLDLNQAALLLAADYGDWNLVREILTESNHNLELGTRISWGNIRPPKKARSCRSAGRRSYFCYCTRSHTRRSDRPDFGYRGNSLIFHAVHDGEVDIVQRAIDDGVDLNEIYGEEPTMELRDRSPTKKKRLEGRSTTDVQSSPLSSSVQGLDPPEEDISCRATLLHIAVFGCVNDLGREDRLEILRLLVQNGARVDTKVWVPRLLLECSWSRNTDLWSDSSSNTVLATSEIEGLEEDRTNWLDAAEFAMAMTIPKEYIEKVGALRESICQILNTEHEVSVG